MNGLGFRHDSRPSSITSTLADFFAGAIIISALLFCLADTVYLAVNYIPSVLHSTFRSRDYMPSEEEQLLERRQHTIYVVRRNEISMDQDNGYSSRK